MSVGDLQFLLRAVAPFDPSATISQAQEADTDFTDQQLKVINRVFIEIAMQWTSSGRSNAARIGKKAQAILEARNQVESKMH